jgi:hypothetical protein
MGLRLEKGRKGRGSRVTLAMEQTDVGQSEMSIKGNPYTMTTRTCDVTRAGWPTRDIP